MNTGFWKKVRRRGATGISKAVARRIVSAMDNPHSHLSRVAGVIHVGASTGQERDLYAKYKLRVLWVEPLPDSFKSLCENLKDYPDQTTVNLLITDKDDAEYVFHVASNGDSSSILEFSDHKDIWPDVHMTGQLMLKSITLDSLLERLGDGHEYQALVMDTQGSELLVLKGATKSLRRFEFIKTEAADFESYVNCARVDELTSYLFPFGFRLKRKDKLAESPKGGQYFDLLYRKIR
jgi:FkbM family methyltransferase